MRDMRKNGQKEDSNRRATIAIVEDDGGQRALYAGRLVEHGYHVTEYADRAAALAGFGHTLPDLALLDIMLGNEPNGGFEIGRYLARRDPALPILFLSSRGDELDRIYGLEIGAWDYQIKPVSLDFLVARVDSLLRIRASRQARTRDDSDAIQAMGSLRLNAATLQAFWRGVDLGLTPTEFQILDTLVNGPELVTYDTLIGATRQGLVEQNTINTHILHLRRKFRRIDPDFDAIRTRHGLGYSWTAG